MEKSANKIKFSLEGDIGIANAMRRVLMNEIPVLSVETVTFEDNNSGLFDEMLAHRLGMIPIKFDPKTMNTKSECKCSGKGCSRCQVKLSIERAGPCLVTSSDVVCDNEIEKNIPITELLENHRLKLEAVAELGIGSEHSKFQSSIVGYNEQKNAFVFNVESVCGLSAMQLVESALDILGERTEEFIKEFKKAAK